MPLNDPYSSGAVARQPRARVLFGGRELPGLVKLSTTGNSHFQADSFAATFALSAGAQQAQGQQAAMPIYDLGFWGEQTGDTMLLDCQFSLDGDWQSFVLGRPDRLSVDPVTKTIHVEGRDLTGLLIDQKTRTTYQNQTSSEIVQKIADSHGMASDVTQTTVPVGRWYGADHTRTTLDSFSETTTEWDLIVWLAQNEGFETWVKGRTLFFHPPADLSAPPYEVVIDMVEPRSNAISVRLERSLALAKDITVAVRSWNSRQKTGFTAFSPSQNRVGVARGTTQEFSFVRPNLSGSEAQALADRIHDELSRKERLLTFTVPGDLILQPRNIVRLRGSDSSWDTSYYCDVVTRTMSLNGGFVQTAHCKNHRTESQVSAP